MKLKKVLAVILTFMMLLGAFPVCAEGATDIRVYLTLGIHGELASDKNGNTMAYVPIDLSGKESYDLDDVFLTAHSLYYEGGEEGYASSEGKWGYGVDKFWGDTSYNFSYLINASYASGTKTPVSDGDYVDFTILTNQYEGFAKFDKRNETIYTNSECSLMLEYFSGYTDDGGNIISPCEDATIIINGEETEYKTDANGEVALSFEKEGTYIVSAKKTKSSGDSEVVVITAPACIIEVCVPKEITIMHNIAKQYKATTDFSVSDSNLPWIIADMITYEELFPESENVLNAVQKESAKKTIVSDLVAAERPGDLAKGILALRALGYDAGNIYTEDFKKIDAVKKLTDLVVANDESVANIYTIPYVLIALSQGDSYSTTEQIGFLIKSIEESKESWQSTEYGTDALTPVLLALSPYAADKEIRALCDETVAILKSEQREDGLIDGFSGYESASTGLAVCALSALGIDSEDVKQGDNSLIDGLLSTANDELNGFSNEFATEQGFRGLLAWRLFLENDGKTIYNFKESPMEEANMAGIENCPVLFKVTPSGATVTIEGIEKVKDNLFDLRSGTYSYSVSASGYVTDSGEIVVSEDDANERILKTIVISLSEVYSGDGGGSVSRPVKDKDKDKPKDEIKEDTEKENTEDENKEETEPDTEKISFDENTFSDISSGDWYYSAVKYVYENKLFNGTDKGFEPNSSMTRAMLVTVLHRLDSSKETEVTSVFSDMPNDAWFTKSVHWATANNIVNGIADNTFAPNNEITREQFATILYRYAVYQGYDTTAKSGNTLTFSDKDEISSYAKDAIAYITSIGVLNGRDGNILAPKDRVTRAEIAVMLERFAGVMK